MEKFVKTSSRWGGVYRFRYFIDGKRYEPSDWRIKFCAAHLGPEHQKVEQTSFGWRDTWTKGN